jgi:hypothetical protein
MSRSIARVYVMKKKSLPKRIALASLYAAGIGAVGVLLGSGLIRCPFAALTHMPCPGCGSTRAVLALLHLHFGEALRFNPSAPLMALCVGVLTIEGLWMVVRDGHARDLAVSGVGRWAVRGIVVAVALQLPIWALRFFGLFGGPVPV